MLIQITLLKNELHFIKELLPVWKKFADGFVFMDDSSDDGSYEYLIENKEKYNILNVIKLNRDESKLTFETDIRQLLFDTANKYSKNIICLDADEYLDGTLSKKDLESLLENNGDATYFLDWIQYTSENTIRIDGPWAENIKDRIGRYESGGKFKKAQTHSTHLPIHNKCLKIPRDQLFISHLQWLDKNFVAIKQYFWKITDYITKNKFKEEIVNSSAYDDSVANFNWQEEYFEYPLKIKSDILEDISNSSNYRIKYINEKTKEFSIPNLGDWGLNVADSVPMYFSTVSDEKHFPLLLNLIGSIHKYHYYDVEEIGVYDLGMTSSQINELNNIKKVKIYQIEKTNEKIFELINTGINRNVKGLFSWKPVVIKQSLEKYPYVVYLDAGSTILKPINNLFKHIIEHGYFLSDCGHSIAQMTPNHIIEKFNLDQSILNDLGIDAGFIGISRKMYDSFIKPIYELSFDINNFVDDGTCPGGYGMGRHDQTLFSIFARKLNLNIQLHDRDPDVMNTNVNGKLTPFIITHTLSKLTSLTSIFRSRWNIMPDLSKTHAAAIKRKYVLSVITGIGPGGKYEQFIDGYFKNIEEQILFNRTEHIVIYSEWSSKFDKWTDYQNIKFIKEKESKGVYNAWNIGLLNCNSEYITNWNVDDLRHPLNTKIKYDMLNNNIDIDMAYNYYVATTTNETFYNINLENRKILQFPDNYHLYATQACLAGPDPMWRKFVHRFIGNFNGEDFSIVADWDMWIRMAKFGCKFKLIPEILCIFSIHENNESKKSEKLENQNKLILQKYGKN